MVDWGGEFSFFQDIQVTNGCYLYYHNTYDHQNWTAGTSREFNSFTNNQTATGNVTTLILHDFKKKLLHHLNKGMVSKLR